jgi:putative ABC transport system ATP-binding protein
VPKAGCFYNAPSTFSPEDRSVLSIRRLGKSFREGSREHRVLEDAACSIADGEVVAVTGRSGSGKSTLLNLISGIDEPESGAVVINGTEVTALREPARTRYRRAHIGFVYQFFNLIPTLSVLENVRLVLELNGVRGTEATGRSRALLAQLGLAGRGDSAVDELSGGEQQRVAIARALVHRPNLVLADEPTGNLDQATAAEVLPVLLGLARSHGAMLVMVTHDAAVSDLADRVLELRDGQLHEAAPRMARA